MSRRKVDDFVEGYLRYVEHSESPRSYHQWAAVSAISAVLGRKAYIRWGHSTLFPNHYIILIGPSGKSRKSDPIVIVRDLIEALNVPTIGEDNSPEAVILDIKRSVSSFTDPDTGDSKFHCSVSAFLEELAVFTGYQNSTFLAYLTNWYDSRDKWTRRTKHQGTDVITGMCFNMLCATAPDWLPHILTRESTGGGFTSRCLFIVEDKKEKLVPDPNLFPPDQKLKEDLLHDLEVIQSISGAYKLSEEANKEYGSWYEAEDKEEQTGDPALDGYRARRPTHVKKVAMCLAAGRNSDRVIQLEDFQRALKMLEAAEVNMPRVFAGLGKSRYAEETETVHALIEGRGTILRSEILQMMYRDLDEPALEGITKTLYDMKFIDVKRMPMDGDILYTSLTNRSLQ